MVNPELENFRALAAALSSQERGVQASIRDKEHVLGIGRYVMLLGREVGVFVRGSLGVSARHMPDSVVLSFVDGQRIDKHALTRYLIFDDRVTVDPNRLNPITNLSVVSLARVLEGIDLTRRAPDDTTPALLVSDQELGFVDRFARDPDNTFSSIRFVGSGQPVAGIEVAYLGPNPL